jgi:hypothetical protein
MKIYILIEKTERNNILGVYTNLKEAETRRNCLAIDKEWCYAQTGGVSRNEAFIDFARRHFEIKEYDVQ